MAKAWADVVSSEQFQSLPADAKEVARQQYFEQVIAPQVPEGDVGLARDQFLKSTSLAPITKKAAPKPFLEGDYDFGPVEGTGLDQISLGKPTPKRKSVLEGQQMPSPLPTEDKYVVRPEFVDAVKAQLDAVPLEQRQAALEKLTQRTDVYGRAARAIAGRYTEADKVVSKQLQRRTDPRLEVQTQRFEEQGLRPEIAAGQAKLQALQGKIKPDFQQLNRDIVGERAAEEAAIRATELEDAGFWKRVQAGVVSDATKSGLGLLSAYADLTDDDQFSRDLVSSRRVEEERGKAIPEGKGVFEKSAQGAMTSLATQAPMMVISAVTGTAAPVLAQVAIQKFGDAYSEGRAANLSGEASTARAVALTSAELIFERLGMTKALAGLKGYISKNGVRGLPEYMAKATVSEIPPEMATTLTQYGIDIVPGVGINKNPSVVDLYKQLEETLRQTVLQAGATAGITVAGVKGVQAASQAFGPREGAYKQDTSYEGEAERIARSKGFLTSEKAPGTDLGELGKERPGEEVSTTPPPPGKTQKEKTIDALTARIASRGVDEAEARAAATLAVEEQERKRLAREEEAANELPAYPEAPNTREEQIFREAVDAGMDPTEAREFAIKQAKQEKKDDDLAKRQSRKKAEGATNVTKPISEPSGEGVSVAGQPSAEPPTGGVAGAEPSGVVPTGQTTTGAPAGEAVEPTALKDLAARYEKRDELVKQLDDAHEEMTKAYDETVRLQQAPTEFVRNGRLDVDARDAARKAADAKFEEAKDKFNAIYNQIEEFDTATAASRKTEGIKLGTETPETIKTTQEGQAAPATGAVTPVKNITLHHGTNTQYETLDPEKSGGMVFFGENVSTAERYAQGAGGGRSRIDNTQKYIIDRNGIVYELTGDVWKAVGIAPEEGLINKDTIQPLDKAYPSLSQTQAEEMTNPDSGTAGVVPKTSRIITKNFGELKLLDISTPEGRDVIAGLTPSTQVGADLVEAAKFDAQDKTDRNSTTQLNTNFWGITKYASAKSEQIKKDIVEPLKAMGYDGIRFQDDQHSSVGLFDSGLSKETPTTKEKTKGKRGPKTKPPEVKAQIRVSRNEQNRINNDADYKLKKYTAQLAETLTPEQIEELSLEEAEQAEIDARQSRRSALRGLLELQGNPNIARGSAVGKRISAALKASKATEAELADIRRGMKAAQEVLTGPKENVLGSAATTSSEAVVAGRPTAMRSSEAKVGKADTGFSKLTNGSQAIAQIIKTGNLFQRFVAQRIRNFVVGVKFVVVEKGDGTPANILKELEGARGLFVYTPGSKERTIYVRGASFGNQQGINNITVLHELLHAATANRVEAGLFKGFRNASLQKFMREMNSLMKAVEKEYYKGIRNGTVSSDLQDLVEVDAGNVEFDNFGRPKFEIFNSPHEFLAYGMSSPEFQKFLMSVQGTRGTGFSGFVNNIRDLFGVKQGESTAFTDLVDITDKMLGTRLTTVEMGRTSLQQRTTKPGTLSKTANPDDRTQSKVNSDVKKALAGVAVSENAEKLADEVSLLNVATDPRKFLEVLNIAYNVGERNTKAVMVNFATTDFLAQDWGGSQVPELKNLNKLIQEMHGMSARLVEGAADPSNVIANAMKAEPSLITKLSQAAYATTNAEIDPSSDKRSAILNKMFADLGPKGREVYSAARDYFTDMAALYGKILDDQINNLSISSQDKANLLTKIKAIYEPRRVISPYFALVRRGPYWLKVGAGQGRQFFMFQSQIQRDYVALRIAISRKNLSASRAEGHELLEEAYRDKSMQIGNNVGSLRKVSYQSSKMLTGLFDAVDNMQLAGLTPEEADVQRENLKDTAYELYLMALPEQSFRNKFLSREGIPGYSTDFLQNFSDTAVTMATQLSRVKYAPKIRASLSAAQDSIEGQVDLEPFVNEMSDRVDLELPGAATSSFLRSGISNAATAGANLLTRAAFIHYLSSASSAILQPLSILQFGLPLLGARHGYTETAAEMVKLFKVWNSYGISTPNSDGTVSYHMPSLRGSKGMTPLENRALQAMIGRNVAQATLASELLARKNKPTTRTLSTTRNILDKGWWGISGGLLMHSAERIAQEIVYLTSFRLSYRNALKKFKKSVKYTSAPNIAAKRKLIEAFENEKFQAFVDQAVVDTHESLGNMTSENRPPIMRNPFGQLVLQFNMFPLHATIHLGKNFFRMIKPMKQEKRWEATKIFFGTMGTTAILFGAVALPMVMTMLGFLNGMWRSNRDDLPKELQDLDFYDWLRTQWLPEYLSGFETAGYLGGKKVRESLVDMLDRGVLNKMTGADFSSRGSLSNLWLREGKETRTSREFWENIAIEKAGASVNQFLAYTDAYQAYKMGNYRTAAEKAAPAFLNKGMLAYKYATEGVKDSQGVQLISKDAISTGEILWQAVGFRSDLLANAQNVNFKMQGIERKIENERSDILKKITTHDESKNLKEYTKAWAEKDKFNKNYPWYQIEDETIDKALDAARERRAMSWKGTQVTEKNAPYTVPAITRSRMDIEAREKEAAERKRIELKGMGEKNPR